MKSKGFLIAAAFLGLLFQGCATMGLSRNIIDFTITPETGIRAGTIVTVSVKTSDDVGQVLGSIDMMGSPKIPLKYDDKNNIWYIRQMVPMGIVIPRGDYLTKIEAITKAGEHFYAEKLISIR